MMRLFAAGLFALGLLWTAPTLACSCLVAPAPQARAAALWVFEGEMLRFEPTGETMRMRATFRVDRVWKGDVPREVTIDVPGPQSMCPPHLSVGQPVILYVGGTPDAPRVASCARYGVLQQLAPERRLLGRPIRTSRRAQSGR